MSQFDAAPPNTHAGGNDDALRTKGNDPLNAPPAHAISDERMNMEEYTRTVPKWKRIWQHSLTQMLLLSVQAFCGPAMADAIAGKLKLLLLSSKFWVFRLMLLELILQRTWRRRSCHSPDFKHSHCNQLHNVSSLLCSGRSNCEQIGDQMGIGHWCLLIPHSRVFILL